MKNIRKQEKGFTIIEVLIVLAIAGLIMLIVFLAVPALQRNSRNNARNNDASRISSAVTECLANRNGQTNSCDDDDEVDPGTLSELTTVNYDTASVPGDDVHDTANVAFGRVCNEDGSGATTDGASARSHVVLFRIEENIPRCIGS